MRWGRLIWQGTMTIAVASCSSSGNGSAPNGGNPGGGGGKGSAADCDNGKACTLMTASDVNQALSTSYSTMDGTSLNDMPGQRTSCFYTHDNDNAASLQMECFPRTLTSSDYSSFASAEATLGFTCTAVSGIGDAALWCVPNPDGGSLPIGPSLLFFSGDVQADLNVTSIGTPTHPVSDFEPIAEQLARTILSRL